MQPPVAKVGRHAQIPVSTQLVPLSESFAPFFRVGRPLRELPRCVVPAAPRDAGGGARDLPVRARRRRHRRRRRRVAGGAVGSPRPFRTRARRDRRGANARRAAVCRSRCRDRAARASDCLFPRPALRVPPGRDDHALHDLCRAPRLLPPLGQSDRAAAAAPQWPRHACQRGAQRRHLHGAAARQLLAGHRSRLAEGPRLPAAGRPRALRRARRAQIGEGRCDGGWPELIAYETARTRALLESGRPLVRAMPWRPALELSGVLAGGHRILDRIDSARGDVFRHRPELGRGDWALVAWRALVPARAAASVGAHP